MPDYALLVGSGTSDSGRPALVYSSSIVFAVSDLAAKEKAESLAHGLRDKAGADQACLVSKGSVIWSKALD